MNCEWIERQSRREEEEVGRVFAGWKETVAVVAIGGRGRGVGGERASGMAWTGQHVDYLLLYRSGNNGIPIMKWISLGSQWTSMHASRDPTPPSPPYPIGLLQPTDVHRAGPPSLVHLSDQPHLYPVSQLDVSAWFSRNHRYSTTLRWKSSLILSRLNIWKIRIS